MAAARIYYLPTPWGQLVGVEIAPGETPALIHDDPGAGLADFFVPGTIHMGGSDFGMTFTGQTSGSFDPALAGTQTGSGSWVNWFQSIGTSLVDWLIKTHGGGSACVYDPSCGLYIAGQSNGIGSVRAASASDCRDNPTPSSSIPGWVSPCRVSAPMPGGGAMLGSSSTSIPWAPIALGVGALVVGGLAVRRFAR